MNSHSLTWLATDLWPESLVRLRASAFSCRGPVTPLMQTAQACPATHPRIATARARRSLNESRIDLGALGFDPPPSPPFSDNILARSETTKPLQVLNLLVPPSSGDRCLPIEGVPSWVRDRGLAAYFGPLPCRSTPGVPLSVHSGYTPTWTVWPFPRHRGLFFRRPGSWG